MVEIYTTPTCSKCRILKDKMKQKGIEYKEYQDIKTMRLLGILGVPWLKHENELMNFKTAVDWLNNMEDVL